MEIYNIRKIISNSRVAKSLLVTSKNYKCHKFMVNNSIQLKINNFD